MGCFSSKPDVLTDSSRPTKIEALHKPVWKLERGESCTEAQLQAKREEFWATQPFYGGSNEIWQALKAACAAEDMDTTKLILEAAGVIVASSDLSVCYDERGFKYDLPKYVLSAPTNLTPAVASAHAPT